MEGKSFRWYSRVDPIIDDRSVKAIDMIECTRRVKSWKKLKYAVRNFISAAEYIRSRCQKNDLRSDAVEPFVYVGGGSDNGVCSLT